MTSISVAEMVWYVSISCLTSVVGAVGGLGGAVLLVPVLTATGTSAATAAPLGMLSVCAGSVAAGSSHLRARSVNHRVGIVTECFASSGVVAGALLSGLAGERPLMAVLALAALLAALTGVTRPRQATEPFADAAEVGERVGSLSGVYPVIGGTASYKPRRLPTGLTLMVLSGGIAGMTGASGGFLKTPTLSDVMSLPTKVAAATVTFTSGITASAALAVFALQGRVEPLPGAATIVGALVGGGVGARAQGRLSSLAIRRGVSVVLVVVAGTLVSRL